MEKKDQPNVIYFENPKKLPDPKPLTAEQIKMASQIVGLDKVILTKEEKEEQEKVYQKLKVKLDELTR